MGSIGDQFEIDWASLVTQMIKNLPAIQDAQISSLEDPLEEEMATHSSILS